jgi:hypothetical protein
MAPESRPYSACPGPCIATWTASAAVQLRGGSQLFICNADALAVTTAARPRQKLGCTEASPGELIECQYAQLWTNERERIQSQLAW